MPQSMTPDEPDCMDPLHFAEVVVTSLNWPVTATDETSTVELQAVSKQEIANANIYCIERNFFMIVRTVGLD